MTQWLFILIVFASFICKSTCTWQLSPSAIEYQLCVSLILHVNLIARIESRANGASVCKQKETEKNSSSEILKTAITCHILPVQKWTTCLICMLSMWSTMVVTFCRIINTRFSKSIEILICHFMMKLNWSFQSKYNIFFSFVAGSISKNCFVLSVFFYWQDQTSIVWQREEKQSSEIWVINHGRRAIFHGNWRTKMLPKFEITVILKGSKKSSIVLYSHTIEN